MPFVSVIMACHNAAPYVAHAIDSVIGQTFGDWELIFVDDHSTDDSLAIALKLAQSDNRIKVYLTKDTKGAGAARNLAFKNASGQWFAILDADDVFLANKLEKQVAVIQSAPANLVLIGTGVFGVNETGQRFSRHKYPGSNRRLKQRLVRGQAFPPHSSLLYKAEAVRALNGFNNRLVLAEDCEFWLRLSSAGVFSCLNDCLIEYRHHPANISKNASSSGYSQKDYSTAAKACYLLREYGMSDPSTIEDQTVWDEFMQHVATEIRNSGQVEYQQWKAIWRSSLTAAGGSLSKIFPVLAQFAVHPAMAWRLFIEHSVGNRLPEKCVQAWLRKNPCAAS